MTQYKIYRDDNYIVVVNNSTLETQYGFTKEVFIDKSNINIPSYRIFNVRDFDNTISLTITQILKEDGSAYTQSDFETFYKQNTGNFNSGGISQGVQSVTGAGVDNTDPQNPVINIPPSGVQTVTGSTVDNTDPENPIINAVEEAPADSNQYLRRNGAWEEIDAYVESVTGTGVDITDPQNLSIRNYIKTNESLALARRIDDTLYGIIDQYTGEEVVLVKMSTLPPSIDNIIYFQLGSEYFRRSYIGDINVKWFGAKGDGQDLFDGNITTGTNILTSATASFLSAAVGKVIGIKGAGTGNSYLITTVTSVVNSTTITLATNAVLTVSNAIFFLGNDDTNFIQNAINSTHSRRGGRIFFPKGVYILNGALKTSTGTYNVNVNSQLWIPYEYVGGVRSNKSTIEFVGEFQPNLHQPVAISNVVGHNTGTTLRSTIQGSGVLPSVIGSRGGSPDDFEEFNRNNFAIKDIQIQLIANGVNKLTMGGINMRKSSIFNAENVTIFPYMLGGSNFGNPDVIEIVGIYFPMYNCEHINVVNKCSVGGFTHGFYLGEHSSLDNSDAVCCLNGITNGLNGHLNYIGTFMSNWCKNDINIVASCYINITELRMETINTGNWFDNTATINDASNLAKGFVNWSIIQASLGFMPSRYRKIGGNFLKTTPMLSNYSNVQAGTAYTFTIEDAYRCNNFTSATAVSVTVPNDTTINFDINAILDIQQSSTGKVTLVPAAGVTINTPSVLSTATTRALISVRKVASNIWLASGNLG